jgi:hypothetical protein
MELRPVAFLILETASAGAFCIFANFLWIAYIQEAFFGTQMTCAGFRVLVYPVSSH